MQKQIYLADPTVYVEDGIYYLYGTNSQGAPGFQAYTSRDLVNWSGPYGAKDGFVLRKGDSFGEAMFWAPQVFLYNGRYYLSYCAEEQCAVAVGDSPLGPFRQEMLRPLLQDYGYKNIDSFLFLDDDGRKYIYYVHQENQNCIYAAQMADDFLSVLPGSERLILEATLPWENAENAPWPVAEGPSVLRHKDLYYMLYSANDYRSKDYAIGCAVSRTPFGPWEKPNAPLISRRNMPVNGTGHGDYFYGPEGKLYYVLHTHNSPDAPTPRRTALVTLSFRETASGMDELVVDENSFRFLTAEEVSL